MSARIDLCGQRFGRWLVVRHDAGRLWICDCDCGTRAPVDSYSLRKGRSNGCSNCHPARGNRKTHGKKPARLYNIWCGMKARCSNPNEPAFARYGGRGIRVCEEWGTSFETFRDWALASGYERNLTIDRIDNDGNYGPGNCRWATYAQQNRNYSRNRPVMYQGREILVCDLAVEVGLPQDVLKNRILRYGWDVERAVSTPVRSRSKQLIRANVDQLPGPQAKAEDTERACEPPQQQGQDNE